MQSKQEMSSKLADISTKLYCTVFMRLWFIAHVLKSKNIDASTKCIADNADWEAGQLNFPCIKVQTHEEFSLENIFDFFTQSRAPWLPSQDQNTDENCTYNNYIIHTLQERSSKLADISTEVYYTIFMRLGFIAHVLMAKTIDASTKCIGLSGWLAQFSTYKSTNPSGIFPWKHLQIFHPVKGISLWQEERKKMAG